MTVSCSVMCNHCRGSTKYEVSSLQCTYGNNKSYYVLLMYIHITTVISCTVRFITLSWTVHIITLYKETNKEQTHRACFVQDVLLLGNAMALQK